MKKLSENLQGLGDRVSNTEQKVSAAKQESKEKVEASIQKAKADAKARQEAFKANVKQTQTVAALEWEELQDIYNQKILRIKNKRETEKEAHEVKKAKQRADDAEAYAEAAIMFVYLAIDEAEVALLEAIDARGYADSIEA